MEVMEFGKQKVNFSVAKLRELVENKATIEDAKKYINSYFCRIANPAVHCLCMSHQKTKSHLRKNPK
jgi:uncharacterized membrane-anchored protein YhcB (DUF1043 family)